jgi:hypothetical protein
VVASSSAQAQTIEDLAWLKGCWRDGEAASGRATSEVWLAPPMQALVGYGFTTNGAGRTVFWEQMRIEARAGAPLAFVAMPMGAAPVRFDLIESGPQRVVFENLAHDDPNRIAYARAGDVLTATVSTTGRPNPLVFHYEHVPCGESLAP